MNELSGEQKTLLSEMHLISLDLADSKNGAVIVNQDETVSIMINEEDHLRIQLMLPGLQLDEALKQIDKIDDLLEERLDFAFDEKIGYLTACPTNVGTGMRASVMIICRCYNDGPDWANIFYYNTSGASSTRYLWRRLPGKRQFIPDFKSDNLGQIRRRYNPKCIGSSPSNTDE